MLQAPDYIKTLRADFARVADAFPKHRDLSLIKKIIDSAEAYDHKKAKKLALNFRYKDVKRNADKPEHIRDESVIGKDWADDPAEPLENGETWNAGRRQTMAGRYYGFDAQMLPVNPYMKTGLTGQGCLGQFGPNHAVDNGVLLSERVSKKTGKKVLSALGIIRRYDNDAPAFSGGFAKYEKGANGAYLLDDDAIAQTQAEEFFEEMVSGSIKLLPKYKRRVAQEYTQMIEELQTIRGTLEIPDQECEEILAQVETHLKLEQVNDHDPEFMLRLKEVLGQGKECFAGPVLNDPRNTDNAWIESRLSWVSMNAKTWDYICGDKVFPYALSAGDDASGVVWHEVDGKLIEKAYASHGPMFAFMAASYMLDTIEKGDALSPDIRKQMQAMQKHVKRLI